MNRPERLRRAVESVAAQTVGPAEVIVVDGGDDDRVQSILSDFDLTLVYVRQSGEGLSNARNLGIEACSSDYIAFLDDDDWWAPEKLERQLQTILHDEVGFVYTGIKHIDQAGRITAVHRPERSPDSTEILSQNSVGAPSSVLVKSECLSAVGGFDEELPTREEWDLYIRLLQSYSATAISTPLVYKEAQEDSISRDTTNLERDWPRIFEKHREKFDKELENVFFSNFQFELGRSEAKNGNMVAARRHFIRSLRHRFAIKRTGYLLMTLFGHTQYRRTAKLYRYVRNFELM